MTVVVAVAVVAANVAQRRNSSIKFSFWGFRSIGVGRNWLRFSGRTLIEEVTRPLTLSFGGGQVHSLPLSLSLSLSLSFYFLSLPPSSILLSSTLAL